MAGAGDGQETGTVQRDREGRSGHHRLVAQPHTPEEGVIAEAEASAAALVTPQYPLGQAGPPMDRRALFAVGWLAAAGALVAVGLAVLAWLALEVLILIGLALVLALGLEPAVSALVGRGWRRSVAAS